MLLIRHAWRRVNASAFCSLQWVSKQHLNTDWIQDSEVVQRPDNYRKDECPILGVCR